MHSTSANGPRQPRNAILPGSTIGILGGGQLGRMVAFEAKRMGYKVVCLDPSPGSPCGQVADDQIVAAYDDLAAGSRLAERSDVVLYEFENIHVSVVEHIEEFCYVPQGSRLLGICQNRKLEKAALSRAGLPVAPYAIVRNRAELRSAVEEIGIPCVLKTCTGGYDGKGQIVIRDAQQLNRLLDDTRGADWVLTEIPDREYVLEAFVPFTHEASVIVARGADGEMAAYPMGENIHRDNVLHATIVPPRIEPWAIERGVEIAQGVAETLDVVGLIAVEMFVTPEGLLINELAPRPHNSGHYTWDACFVSQFEQLVRAACGLALGPTELLTPVVMLNILGEHLEPIMRQYASLPGNVRAHLYGKSGGFAAKRKMGHLTVKTDDPDGALAWFDGLWRTR